MFLNIMNAKNRTEYIQMLEDSMDTANMTREQVEYEYEDHIIFDNGKVCLFKRYLNTFYVGRVFGDEGCEFYLDMIDKIKLRLSDTGEYLDYDATDSLQNPSILDIIEKEGFPIHFKLFRDYGQ